MDNNYTAPSLTLEERVLVKKNTFPLGDDSGSDMISFSLPCPGLSPVAVDWAFIHLDRCSLWAEQASRRRLQLCPQTTHTGVSLKCVWPALRVLVHHLQHVAVCRLRDGRYKQRWSSVSLITAAEQRYGGQEMWATFEVSMFCHLLRGSATTSQSGHDDWRSRAKVDFPTAVWEDKIQETA